MIIEFVRQIQGPQGWGAAPSRGPALHLRGDGGVPSRARAFRAPGTGRVGAKPEAGTP